jgi:hypothetical protein
VPTKDRLKLVRERLVEIGNEIVVTYESTETNGSRFRNTEVLTFAGDKICKAEIDFGRNLPKGTLPKRRLSDGGRAACGDCPS